MFTGLIETLGRVKDLRESGSSDSRKRTLTVASDLISAKVKLGDSIAIAGVCLTVTSFTKQSFTLEAVGDTLVKTTLGQMRRGATVNLERAMAADGRLDGHIVQGHVNGVATVRRWQTGPGHSYLTVELPPSLAPDVVPEGSIAIDGVSLTVAGIGGSLGNEVRVSLIPHTLAVTTLGALKPGDVVNIETDILTRRSVRSESPRREGLTMEKLASWGYT